MKSHILSFFMLMHTMAYAQLTKDQSGISLSARSYADHIVLRYMPASPILFNQGNRFGYRVERADFIKGISNEKLNYKPVKDSPFKRWPDDEWERAIRAARSRDTLEAKYLGLAMAYSALDEGSSGGDLLKEGLTSLKEQQVAADMKFGYALIAANKSSYAAEGLALKLSDTDVKPGQIYVYRVAINKPSANMQQEAAYLKVTCGNFDPGYLRNDKQIKVTEADREIRFSFPEGDDYYAFHADRSDDNGKTWQRINRVGEMNIRPVGFNGAMDFAYGDTALINYKRYHYRIWVSTYFADELLLAEVSAMPRDLTPPPAPFLKTATHIKPKQVELVWEIRKEGSEDLRGFAIHRGTQENGKYQLLSKTILPASSTRYIDESFDPDGSNYYIVEAVDTAGNSSHSFPAYVTLIDSVPPAAPVITLAKIDTAGKVLIRIKPAAEKDFMGYQLLKANAKDHEFSVVTETYKDSLGRSTFTLTDSTTLNTLTKKIYYKVIAFDTHFNPSAPSEIIELKKRDTIPPVSPLIRDFNVTDTSVVIFFANSSSEDAVRNYLLRRESGKAKFDTLYVNTDVSIGQFTDLKISGGKAYEYAMMAKDDGGLFSKISRSILLKTRLHNRLPAPVMKGVYMAAQKQAELTFQVDEKLKNRKISIELYQRPDERSGWKLYKTIAYQPGMRLTEHAGSDYPVLYYMIRLIDENKNSSNYSDELVIKIQ